MKIIADNISRAELKAMAGKMFGNLVKAVVDIQRKTMAVDGELHSDEEALLLENGSLQKDLWGINIYPELEPDDADFIEFDSMINLRPAQGNRSRGVDDPAVRLEIADVVRRLVA